jgi:hypothetical protein
LKSFKFSVIIYIESEGRKNKIPALAQEKANENLKKSKNPAIIYIESEREK